MGTWGGTMVFDGGIISIPAAMAAAMWLSGDKNDEEDYDDTEFREHTWTTSRLGLALRAAGSSEASKGALAKVIKVDRKGVPELPKWLKKGVTLMLINGESMAGKPFAEIMKALKSPRELDEPITLSFAGSRKPGKGPGTPGISTSSPLPPVAEHGNAVLPDGGQPPECNLPAPSVEITQHESAPEQEHCAAQEQDSEQMPHLDPQLDPADLLEYMERVKHSEKVTDLCGSGLLPRTPEWQDKSNGAEPSPIVRQASLSSWCAMSEGDEPTDISDWEQLSDCDSVVSDMSFALL